jgi:hypothetical protein
LTIADIRAIARGHAWTKHAEDWTTLRIGSPEELTDVIGGIVTGPGKSLDRGRHAWYDDGTGILVIFDPDNADKGTAFIPKHGRACYEGLQ